MGVVVLNPQDCLKNPLSKQPLISPQMKNQRYPNPNYNRPNRTPQRKRRSPPRPNNSSPPSRTMVVVPPKFPANNLVMGQVKILKRGEELSTETTPSEKPKEKKIENSPEISDLCSTERLGPDPELVSTQIRKIGNFYAGSACITSPPPSSLPLPAFFTKKCVIVNNDDATSDLRRILRLDV